MRGKFIVVEGLEGAGKTTGIKHIESILFSRGIENITKTREPGGTPLAEQMRKLVKEGHDIEALTDMSELLLMYAARSQLVENVIKPALSSGVYVIGDRHDLSSQAYQGGGRQIDANVLQTLRNTVLGDFRPDLTLYLDVEPELGLERARERGQLDRIEKMDLAFFHRTRERYLALASSEKNIICVDASQAQEAVIHAIGTALNQWLDNAK